MKTKISKGFQVVVPSLIRSKYKLEPGDFVEWVEENRIIKVKPRRRRKIEDVLGMIAVEADAVSLKKKVQKGGM